MAETLYIPVLKTKDGELRALSDLTPDVKTRLTPLLEIPPPGREWESGDHKPLEEHIAALPPKIAKHWGTEQPVFVDAPYLIKGKTLSRGTHPMKAILDRMLEESVAAVPVTSLARERAYQDAVRAAVRRDRRGLLIRLEPPDLDDLGTFASRLEQLLMKLEVDAGDTTLMVDLKEINPGNLATLKHGIRPILQAIPSPNDWRELVLASCAFPINFARMKRDHVRLVPRADWELWRSVTSGNGIPRAPLYADYAIQHPEPFDGDPKQIHISASIRYTGDDDYVVVKGRGTKKTGWAQTQKLCAVLVGRPEYKGASFSWGDEYIDRRARGKVSCGNASKWRRVGTGHHLTLAAQQIASLGGS